MSLLLGHDTHANPCHRHLVGDLFRFLYQHGELLSAEFICTQGSGEVTDCSFEDTIRMSQSTGTGLSHSSLPDCVRRMRDAEVYVAGEVDTFVKELLRHIFIST